MNLRTNKLVALLSVAVAYGFAVASAAATVTLVGDSVSLLVKTFMADLVATGVVFICSAVVDNSSMYDPYWSLAPPLMVWYWMDSLAVAWSLPVTIFFVAMCAWSLRLTCNCLLNWKHLGDEDWRYVGFRKRFGVWYWPVSLGAVHLFPTIIVFGCCIPAYTFIARGGVVETWPWFLLGATAMAGAFLLQLVADNQMRLFLQEHRGSRHVCSTGLWGISRHPNYLGEILFWYGITACSWATTAGKWTHIVFPLAMTALFLGYSIPAMEKRLLARRDGYSGIQKRIPMLIPRIGRPHEGEAPSDPTSEKR